MFNVTREESALIARFTRLRSRVIALSLDAGIVFACAGARAWKASGVRGLAAPCRFLAFALEGQLGNAMLWKEARDLAREIEAAIAWLLFGGAVHGPPDLTQSKKIDSPGRCVSTRVRKKVKNISLLRRQPVRY